MIVEPDLHTDDFYVLCAGSDPAKLDMNFLVSELLDTYWGSWRTHEIIAESVRNSICFGLWSHGVDDPKKDRQVGFARVVTDHATFSWLADVFITPKHQKKGLGSFLMTALVDQDVIARRACYLSTRDRHHFYARFGFERQGNSNVMRRLPSRKDS